MSSEDKLLNFCREEAPWMLWAVDKIPVTLESLLADGASRTFLRWFDDTLEIARDSVKASFGSCPKDTAIVAPMGKKWVVIGYESDLDAVEDWLWDDKFPMGFNEARWMVFARPESELGRLMIMPIGNWVANRPWDPDGN